MLAERRLANAVQIEGALARTARDSAGWHPGFGNGGLDIIAFIRELCQ